MPSNKMENLWRIVVRSFGLPQAAIYICQDSLVHGVGGEEVGLLLPVTTRELKNLGACLAVMSLPHREATKVSD